ncbi:phage holin family protein, partial [Salmonella enterica]|uniref:phage holin family protein n=1 Tax=Salmonella enterica TaxID=28901 RepID=UPI000EB89971
MSAEANKEPDFFVNAKDELKQYLQDRLLLVKMQATEKGSRLISTLVVGMLGALLFFFILLFLSLVAGFVLSSLFNNFYIGFGI